MKKWYLFVLSIIGIRAMHGLLDHQVFEEFRTKSALEASRVVHDAGPFRGGGYHVVSVDLGWLTVGYGVVLDRERGVVVVVGRRVLLLGHSAIARVHAAVAVLAVRHWVVTVALRHLHEVRHPRSKTAVVGVVWNRIYIVKFLLWLEKIYLKFVALIEVN